jgi:hypothetical protein
MVCQYIEAGIQQFQAASHKIIDLAFILTFANSNPVWVTIIYQNS